MNRNVLSNIAIFVAGAGIGAAVTWKLVKTKYEQIAREEIESVREAFSNREAEASVEEEAPDESEEDRERESDIREYNSVLNDTGYAAESTEKEVDNMGDKPYVIEPEEFGECDYATLTYTYYTDGTVTNEQGKIVANVDELIGEESLQHFGDNEDDPDCVYVRNDRLEIDFEILMDYRDYSEVD